MPPVQEILHPGNARSRSIRTAGAPDDEAPQRGMMREGPKVGERTIVETIQLPQRGQRSDRRQVHDARAAKIERAEPRHGRDRGAVACAAYGR